MHRLIRYSQTLLRSIDIDVVSREDIPSESMDEFAGQSKRLTAAGLRVTAIVISSLAILAWPTDPLFFGWTSPEFVVFFKWRLLLLGSCAAALAALRWSRFFIRHPALVALSTIGIPVGASGWLMAELGGLESPFTYGIYTVPLLSVLLVVELRYRIAVAFLFAIAYFICFFSVDPSHLVFPYLDIPFVWTFASTVAAIVVGHIIYVLLRTNFLQKTKLDGFARDLQTQVREQTAEIRELAARISEVQEQERARIARDLHDDMGQKLVGLGMEIQLAQKQLSKLGDQAQTASQGLQNARKQIHGIHESLDEVLSALRPRALEESGFDGAVSRMVRESADKNNFTADLDIGINVESLSPAASIVLFRIVQEALTNIARHARAHKAHIQLNATDQGVLLRITDDGVGFDPSAVKEKGRLGLQGIIERSYLLNGTCRFESRPGQGSKIEIVFPSEKLGQGDAR